MKFLFSKYIFIPLFFGINFVYSKPDSLQIFYERHNSFLTVGLEDYKAEIKVQLGSKADAYLQNFDTLVLNCTGKILFLRNGFWSATASYSRSDYPALEAAGFSLFKKDKAKLKQKEIYFSYALCETSEQNFYVCNKKEMAVAGVELRIQVKADKATLLSIPKSVTAEFVNKEWCK